VTQPMEGAKKEGAAGFLKGMGKGFGGIVFKPGAAFWSVPGYMMKGIYQELQAINGSSILNYIIAARTAQGYADWHNSHPQERADIIERWLSLQNEIEKKKNPDEALRDWALAQQHKRTAWQKEQKQKIKNQLKSQSFRDLLRRKKSGTEAEQTSSGPSTVASSSVGANVTTPTSTLDSKGNTSVEARQSPSGITNDDAELEEAIRQSVAASSEGNAEEDAVIERALQASIRELRNQAPPHYGNGSSADDEEDEAIRTAMAASIVEAERHSSRVQQSDSSDADMEAAIKASIEHERRSKAKDMTSNEAGASHDAGHEQDEHEWNDDELASALRMSKHPALRSAFDINASAQAAGDEQVIRETTERGESGHKGAVTEDEEMEHEREAELQRAGRNADGEKTAGTETETETGNSAEDEEMARALRESLAAHRDEQGRVDEEKVVLEYVKKQSQLEEQHRRALLGKAAGGRGRSREGETGSSTAVQSQGGEGGGDEDDDEELKQAIKMSMDHQRGA